MEPNPTQGFLKIQSIPDLFHDFSLHIPKELIESSFESLKQAVKKIDYLALEFQPVLDWGNSVLDSCQQDDSFRIPFRNFDYSKEQIMPIVGVILERLAVFSSKIIGFSDLDVILNYTRNLIEILSGKVQLKICSSA